jgi:hypothetical protein
MTLFTMFFVPAMLFRTLDFMLVEDDSKQPPPCSSVESRQFDFWVGEWNLNWKAADGKEKSGTNKITKPYDGCVIREEFVSSVDGFAGTSLSAYDANAKKWKQTWVDNSGSYLDFVGEFKDGRMVLSRKMQKGGKEFLQRMQWYDITAKSFTWNWERSDDNGKSWTVIWKIQYTRRNGGAQG